MAAPPPPRMRNRAASTNGRAALLRIETDPAHHLAGPFMPQTPIDAFAPAESPRRKTDTGLRLLSSRNGLWSDIKTMRWAVETSSSLKLLLIPVVFYANWAALAPYVAPDLPNPFEPFIFLSHHVPTSSPDDPRYAKGYFDFLFVAYYIVFFSFVRQVITVSLFRPIGKYFGVTKRAKLDRYGEQGHALVYFTVMGIWGVRVMAQLPTWWYKTEFYWLEYPHWDMKPELKRYYLMQAAHWCQELLVLVMGLEKPRKDYAELVAHHIVTLWLIGWSYVVNLTLIGNAVYVSMDIPDVFLAFSKLLNYMRWDRAKSVSFAIFVVVWTYFRHWKNLVIMWSVWTQFDSIPQSAQQWIPEEGVYMIQWMKYQIFAPITLLQLLNCFWYFLILRIMYRAIFTTDLDDTRSDDEGDGQETEDESKRAKKKENRKQK